MTTEMPEVGSIIDGRYRLESVLGEGGFGIVYKAKQTSTGQTVAIKLLNVRKAGDDEEVAGEIARFEREMQLIARLKHPNIVRLIDTGATAGGQLYTVLEYIDGQELSQLIKTEGALKPAEAKNLMFQVLDALSVAHQQGVIHRDLKPQNIMVTNAGYRRNAMVLDFGISAIMEEARDESYKTLTAANRIHGTPAYMAPEQLRAMSPIPQTDIYAWGLVFLECLIGRRVIDGQTFADIVAAQISLEPVLIPEQLLRHPLGNVIVKATAKEVENRYPSAAVALRELESLVFPAESVFPWTGRIATDEQIHSGSISARMVRSGNSSDYNISGQMQIPGHGGPHDQKTMAAPSISGQHFIPRNPAGQLSPSGQYAQYQSGQHPSQLQQSGPYPMQGQPYPSGSWSGEMPVQQGSSPLKLVLIVGVLVLLGVGAALFYAVTKGGGESKAAEETAKEEVPAPETQPSPIVADTAPKAEEKKYRPGESYAVKGTQGGDLIFVEGGPLTMGVASLDDMLLLCGDLIGDLVEGVCQDALFSDLQPTKETTVKDLFVDRLEVRNEAYTQCVASGSCHAIDVRRCEALSNRGPFEVQEASDAQFEALADVLTQDDLPATCVNQAEAQVYCQWAGKRLLSEAEWEYVASNGGRTLFPWGSQSEAGGSRANGSDESLISAMGWKSLVLAYRAGSENSDGYPFSAPAGSFPAGRSSLGIQDLAGNVREWVSDGYSTYDGVRDPSEAMSRGGGWADAGPWLSSRIRLKMKPQVRRSDLGFRCALSLSDVRE